MYLGNHDYFWPKVVVFLQKLKPRIKHCIYIDELYIYTDYAFVYMKADHDFVENTRYCDLRETLKFIWCEGALRGYTIFFLLMVDMQLKKLFYKEQFLT